jgi:two-component system, response regulator PdtaR
MADPSVATESWIARGPTILVVEDEIIIRVLLADELRAAGYRVVETICADEALTILRGGIHIDLVLTDVQMPGSLNGYGLARVIRSEFPDTKIIIASAHAANDTSLADATFLKPYDFDVLVSLINSLLG